MNKRLPAAFVEICTSGADPLFHACDVRERSLYFVGTKRQKSEGAKSGLYGGCGRTVQRVLTGLQSVVIMCLCEYPGEPPTANFAAFQRIESDTQLSAKFPGRKTPIFADEMIEGLFIP
jgi:hypothetical protein